MGLTPNQIPGETDIDGRISKIGDAWVRALYAAANIMLTKSLKGCTTFKSWAMKVARMKSPGEVKIRRPFRYHAPTGPPRWRGAHCLKYGRSVAGTRDPLRHKGRRVECI